MRTDATPAATTITTVPLTELVPDWLYWLIAQSTRFKNGRGERELRRVTLGSGKRGAA
jgi:hypothetical protein